MSENKYSSGTKLLIVLCVLLTTWVIFREFQWYQQKKETLALEEHFSSDNPSALLHKELVKHLLNNDLDSLEFYAHKIRKTNKQLSKQLKKYIAQKRPDTSKETFPQDSTIVQVDENSLDANEFTQNNAPEDSEVELLPDEKEESETWSKFYRFKSSNGKAVIYTGEMENGKANGKGTGVWENGHKYVGEWVNNKREGKGIYTQPDGESYDGTFKNDRKNGEGTYVWKNKLVYKGQWKEDKRHGYGTLYDKKGKVEMQGEWANDQLISSTKK